MKIDRKILVTAIPIICVNLVSILAQYQYWHDHLPTWGIPGQILFAFSLESIAIQLAYFAHLSQVSADSAMRLKIGAVSIALVIGALNASHYVVNGRLTAASIGVFTCSAMSPWLWGIFSRRQSRDILIEKGLIEPHAVRLGIRWLFWPRESFEVFRNAVWAGESEPAAAITAWEDKQASEPEPEILPVMPPVNPEPEALAHDERMPELPAGPEPASSGSEPASKAHAVRQAINALGANAAAPDVSAWLSERGIGVSPAYVRQVKSIDNRRAVSLRRESMRAQSTGKPGQT